MSRPIVFRPDPEQYDHMWARFLQPFFGTFAVTDPARYGLQPGVKLPGETNTELFIMTMAHQLHCLVGDHLKSLQASFVLTC